MAKEFKQQGYNWDRIEEDYITDHQSSYVKISKKYGIAYTSIKNYAIRNDWYKKKLAFRDEVKRKALAKVAAKRSTKLAQELDAVNKVSDVVTSMLQDTLQFNRHLVTTTEGVDITTTEQIFGKVDTRAMKDVLQSLKLIEDMKRSMMEEQRLSERQRHEMEKERLALERERLELERERIKLQHERQTGPDLDEGKYGVVLIPGIIGDQNNPGFQFPGKR